MLTALGLRRNPESLVGPTAFYQLKRSKVLQVGKIKYKKKTTHCRDRAIVETHPKQITWPVRLVSQFQS